MRLHSPAMLPCLVLNTILVAAICDLCCTFKCCFVMCHYLIWDECPKLLHLSMWLSLIIQLLMSLDWQCLADLHFASSPLLQCYADFIWSKHVIYCIYLILARHGKCFIIIAFKLFNFVHYKINKMSGCRLIKRCIFEIPNSLLSFFFFCIWWASPIQVTFVEMS